jgi:hypothetical protein
MTKFKCLQSGNVVSFENEWDIVQMKAHPDYTEVKEVETVEVVEEPLVIKKATLKAKPTE